ncbi:DUF6461 domain-containing protein [Micromonospora sp. NPDC049679]|uniref:DUF6461 domain-containing protein n=1 Tax=Micromonospora sp. NPDC049679 TaxID=3155920 RepID=UPI0033CA65E0
MAVAALRELGPLPAERLLGALELTVAGLELPDAPDLSAYLPPPPAGALCLYSSTGHDSEAVTAAVLLERLRPGVADLVVSLARRLAAHPSVIPLLAQTPDADDESAIAAQHGAGYLSLAVATACAVIDQAHIPPVVDRAVAMVGVGIGAAAVLLQQAPMPPTYAPALLAKIRAEYLLPRQAFGSVRVSTHRFALIEGQIPDNVDFAGNGLVAVVDSGAVIRTGVAEGGVQVQLTVLTEGPPEVESGWEEVVEVSWRAAEGRASVVGPDGNGAAHLQGQTPPWPGDYRLRVHARSRDDGDNDFESYHLVVWAAPATSQVVHRRMDRLGHRLRGEPEPVRPPRPEHAYRWIRRSPLSVAATVTVATGATVEEVLLAFGADPHRSATIRDIEQNHGPGSLDPWVAVLDTTGAVLAVEYNGFEGSRAPVVRTASARGRAASMFWNVNAVTRLSFAEQGRLLASFEPWGDLDADPVVTAALAGLDFAEPGFRTEKGLVAVERFTGRGITAADLDRIQDAGTGFRIARRE